jgi:transcriptional regulator with XRE-family HTH domain
MSIGNNIKKLRELKNYTQAYMASQLDLSIGGYGKIERDETDVTLSRLNEIAKVLDTSLTTLLEFNSSNIFNQYNNKNATQNAVFQIQNENGLNDLISKINEEIKNMKNSIANIEKRYESI